MSGENAVRWPLTDTKILRSNCMRQILIFMDQTLWQLTIFSYTAPSSLNPFMFLRINRSYATKTIKNESNGSGDHFQKLKKSFKEEKTSGTTKVVNAFPWFTCLCNSNPPLNRYFIMNISLSVNINNHYHLKLKHKACISQFWMPLPLSFAFY